MLDYCALCNVAEVEYAEVLVVLAENFGNLVLCFIKLLDEQAGMVGT